MPLDLNKERAKQLLREFDFQSLFLDELGWDRFDGGLPLKLGEHTIPLQGVAEKKGMTVYLCPIPRQTYDYQTRCKIDAQLAKCVREHLIIYVDKEHGLQIWQWVKREPGKPMARREHAYNTKQTGDALIQKLEYLKVTLEEEEKTTLPDVTGKAKKAFDLEKITKRFYDRFKAEHAAFLNFIEGIPDEDLERWYTSVMINRLMFIYFIQKKGFLDNDKDYLRNKLKITKDFYRNLLCPLFFEGFAKKERSKEINELLGKVPYLNGGIFQPHQIEQQHRRTIDISNKAFEKLFAFFDEWQWHLDERPLRDDREINPDVLGYIFEKYINQKQMGAYYTKEDITEYIGKNTIIPRLFDMAKAKCKVAFEKSGTGVSPVWNLLKENPDRYIYDAVRHGSEKPLPAEITYGVKDVSKRTEWNKPAPAEHALPTEIWREVVARRKRYEEVRKKLAGGDVREINDLITLNLNIRQFAQDVIENCEGPELLVAFWNAIESVTVLDPTCGSGAFLFAALNILEPLYEACLGRMQAFLDEWGETGTAVPAVNAKSSTGQRPLPHSKNKHPIYKKLFSETLARVEDHPNKRYFIFKTMILNNLYGVDIMEEAVEICKLRLFLKLAAQVEPDTKKENYGIEPLPDIDFNIRAGNTLVGFATEKEVRRCMTEFGGGQQRLGIGDELKSYARFADKLQIADAAFRSFRDQQTRHGGYISKEDKDDLQKKLAVLDNELNRYLADEYTMGLSNKPKDYAAWLKSHQPFHWFVEFYGIMQNGGFDVIIGNPPYVKYSKMKKGYIVHGYKTEECGNLYAFVIERGFGLTQRGGRFGMIVPIASVSTNGMKELQSVYRTQAKQQWHSHYATRPGKLFVGVDMNLTITIVVAESPKAEPVVFATTYYRWRDGVESDRDSLFERIEYLELPTLSTSANMFPKIGRDIETNILKNIYRYGKKLKSFYAIREKIIYYHSGGRYWRKALLDALSSHYKGISLDRRVAPVALCLLNSQLFYWYWITNSNCMDVVSREVDEMPVFDFNVAQFEQFERLQSRLLKAYFANSQVRQRRGDIISTDETNFDVKESKPIIDEVDRVLAKHYGFTDEELDFIINYDIKYRMGLSAEQAGLGGNMEEE